MIMGDVYGVVVTSCISDRVTRKGKRTESGRKGKGVWKDTGSPI